jgi:hypothetical protein
MDHKENMTRNIRFGMGELLQDWQQLRNGVRDNGVRL